MTTAISAVDLQVCFQLKEEPRVDIVMKLFIINIAGTSVLLRVLQTPAVRKALIVGCGLQIIQQFTGVNALV